MRKKQSTFINWIFYPISVFCLASSLCFADPEVLVLKHAIRAGEILTAEDLEWKTTQNIPSGAIQNPLDIIGKSAKHNLQAGLTMYPDLFELSKVIQQGQTVEVILRSGSLDIRYTGIATQNGARGQTINVRMPSGTTIGATVLGPGQVLVP